MKNLDKFFKVIDKVIFWVDLDKIRQSRTLLIIFIVIFFSSIVMGPLSIVFVVGFLSGLRG